MKLRRLPWLGLVAALALTIPAGPALARSASKATPRVPTVSISWQEGVPSTFAGTRFDGEYDPTTKRVYFLGFRTTGDLTDGSVWYYDTVAKTYTDTGVDMPVPVSNYGIAALTTSAGLGFYIFGGRDANAVIVTAVQAYFPATNTAVKINADPWPGMTPLGCVSLPAMGVVSVANRAIVMGGVSFAANGCLDDQSAQTWIFNPKAPNGARWTAGPDLNVARGYITPAVLGNKIYAIGGDTVSAGSLIPQATVESWKAPSGTWDDAGTADLPEACDESQAFGFTQGALAGTITLAGCGQWPNALPDTLQYTASSNSWATVGTLNDNRRNQAGATVPVGTKFALYILGGYGEASSFIDPIPDSELGRAGAAAAHLARIPANWPDRNVPTS